MGLDFHGRVVDERRIRAGFIGCGSHAFRNVYPTFQFAPVELLATCDLDLKRAKAFAKQFGADQAFSDYREMLKVAEIDVVFIVTNYDDLGRPRYPELAIECLKAVKHVWMEKPPAASCEEIDRIAAAAKATGRQVLVGLKKMFSPGNEKAAALMQEADFGKLMLATFQYPTAVPTVVEFERYHAGENLRNVVGFLDHICHPASAMVFLMGMPQTLLYQRTANGSALATFTFSSGAIATLALPASGPSVGGLERTQLYSDKGRRIVVENNIRVSYHRDTPTPTGTGYG
jgi:predicted dehydrogenase